MMKTGVQSRMIFTKSWTILLLLTAFTSHAQLCGSRWPIYLTLYSGQQHVVNLKAFKLVTSQEQDLYPMIDETHSSNDAVFISTANPCFNDGASFTIVDMRSQDTMVVFASQDLDSLQFRKGTYDLTGYELLFNTLPGKNAEFVNRDLALFATDNTSVYEPYRQISELRAADRISDVQIGSVYAISSHYHYDVRKFMDNYAVFTMDDYYPGDSITFSKQSLMLTDEYSVPSPDHNFLFRKLVRSPEMGGKLFALAEKRSGTVSKSYLLVSTNKGKDWKMLRELSDDVTAYLFWQPFSLFACGTTVGLMVREHASIGKVPEGAIRAGDQFFLFFDEKGKPTNPDTTGIDLEQFARSKAYRSAYLLANNITTGSMGELTDDSSNRFFRKAVLLNPQYDRMNGHEGFNSFTGNRNVIAYGGHLLSKDGGATWKYYDFDFADNSDACLIWWDENTLISVNSARTKAIVIR